MRKVQAKGELYYKSRIWKKRVRVSPLRRAGTCCSRCGFRPDNVCIRMGDSIDSSGPERGGNVCDPYKKNHFLAAQSRRFGLLRDKPPVWNSEVAMVDGWSLGRLINRAQSTFVGLLRIWSIPIVLLLSVASGYTTYYGMTYFITWWIALIITVAVQSILVICSLEIAGIHWRANRLRYLVVACSLLISMAASISFSYFKFYEISQKESTRLARLEGLQKSVDGYLDDVFELKSALLAEQQRKADNAEREASLAYLGTHPDIAPRFRNQVGKGPFWAHYTTLFNIEQKKLKAIEAGFAGLSERIRALRTAIGEFGAGAAGERESYQTILNRYISVQNHFDELVTDAGHAALAAPILPPYAQFVQSFKPSFAMWEGFSWFAFACAAMVDFFTFLLSYRLEFTAPGPLNEYEQKLAYQALSQFSELKINRNDELEVVIEKSELERARRYPDWNRMFGVAFLLSRGYLRKVNNRSVEFAPNLYPVIAEHMVNWLKQPENSEESGEKETNVKSGEKITSLRHG